MIDKRRIDNTHQQKGDTCLLSNYAVTANYFTGISIYDYFIDYLKQFQNDFLTSTKDIYGQFFHSVPGSFKNEFNKVFQNGYHSIETIKLLDDFPNVPVWHLHTICKDRGWAGRKPEFQGLDFIKLLHDESDQKSYVCSRKIVDLAIDTFSSPSELKKIIAQWKDDFNNTECIFNVYSAPPDKHSYTIYKDSLSQLVYVHDTNNPCDDYHIDEDLSIRFNVGQVLKYTRK